MSRIDDLLAELCPDGVEFKRLGDVGTFTRGNGLQKKDLADEGVGAIHYGQVFTAYGTATHETISRVSPELAQRLRKAKTGDLIIATTSENDEDVCKAVAWLGDEEIAFSGDAFCYAHQLDPLYAAYVFQSAAFQGQKRRFISGTKVKRVSGTDLGKITIPVPPLEIQREIASILDKMEALQAELQAELQLRSQQYEYYRDQLMKSCDTPNVPWVPLGDVTSIQVGQPLPAGALTKEGEYQFINAGTSASGQTAVMNTSGDTVTIPSRGQGGVGIPGYQAKDFWCGPLCYRVRASTHDLSTRFLYHYLKSIQPAIRALQQTGGTPALNRKELVLVPTPSPSRAEQERIVAILDRFDALVNDISSGLPAEIEARRQQYEYYRDKLLTFPEKKASA